MKNFVEKYFKAHHVVILIWVLLGLFFAVALGESYVRFSMIMFILNYCELLWVVGYQAVVILHPFQD